MLKINIQINEDGTIINNIVSLCMQGRNIEESLNKYGFVSLTDPFSKFWHFRAIIADKNRFFHQYKDLIIHRSDIHEDPNADFYISNILNYIKRQSSSLALYIN